MTEFQEADARLGGMHGYGEAACPRCAGLQQSGLGVQHCERHATPEERHLGETVAEWQSRTLRRLDERLQRVDMMLGPEGLIGAWDRLEAKVDALMKALQAGAIGKWTP